MTKNPPLPASLVKLKNSLCAMDEDTVEIVVSLYGIFNDMHKVVLWLKAKNPAFGDLSPLRIMQLGRSSKVKDFVEMAWRDDWSETRMLPELEEE